MAATTLVAVLKHETDSRPAERGDEGGGGGEPSSTPPADELELGVAETYAMLWRIITLPLMPLFIAVLLTQKVVHELNGNGLCTIFFSIFCGRIFQIGFSAADSVTSLKLIEQGVPKDKLAMLAIPIIPVQVRSL